MKNVALIFSILLLAACAQYRQYANCKCPNGHRMPTKSEEDMVKAEGAKLFPVTVYTYDLSLLKYTSRVLDSMNAAFLDAGIQFELRKSVEYAFPEIEELTARNYKEYYSLSDLLDVQGELAIWLVPPGDVCDKTRCSSTKGFSNINGMPSNIVLTDFGWYNTAVAVHEMGHWFGLDHTTDDDIEDTPYDPGNLYSVYISYDDCEMHHPKGYKPMLENFMAYYEHCPNKRKRFTPMQNELMMSVAWNYKSAYAVR